MGPRPHPVADLAEVPEAAGEASIRVVLAEGHEPMRRAMRQLLDRDEDITVIAEAEDLETAVALVGRLRPDVVAVDLGMGHTMGETIEPLLETPATRLVVCTMDDLPTLAARAIDCGALGVVRKQFADDELGPAIRAAARGQTYVGPRIDVGPRIAGREG